MRNKYRKYIFTIIFFKNSENIKTKFLIFHRKKNWKGWEFLKGGLMEGENEMNALKREVREETGHRKFKIIAKTKHFIKYMWSKGYRKDHHIFHGANGRVFVVQLFNKKIKIDKEEHDNFKWVDARQVFKYLTYINLKHAFKYVLKNYKL